MVNPLARIPGVGTVSISGAPQREIQVYCDPNKLEAYHLTIETISSIIGAENKNIPGGNFDIGSETYALRVEGEFDDSRQLADVVDVYKRQKLNTMLADLTVKDFLDKVACSDPVPGGGSIAALNGALASALSTMVARLTVGKKGYEASEEVMQHAQTITLRLLDEFIALIDKDSAAYNERCV